MVPTRSNTADQGCSPVSSNCVIWQGPDLPCINLCNGDTVSSVVHKVATYLCTIQSSLDLTDLDLSCLVAFCTNLNPAPTEKTLPAVLEFIIEKVCCLNTRIDDLPEPGNNYVEPTLTLPSCLQYTDPVTGQLVTQLIHHQFTLHLANRFCLLKTTVDQHTTQITNLDNRVTILENQPPTPLPLVTPKCILVPGTPTAMNTVLTELESQYCDLRAVLGANTALAVSISQQCANLGSQPALSQAGTMSNLAGWNTTLVNLAQSFQNLWITVCDMRAAIQDLKDCCTTVDCTQFILNYTAGTDELREEVYLDFNPGTVIPAGFSNCSQLGSLVTISDGTTTKDFYIDLVSLATDPNPYTAVVAGSGVVGPALNTSLPYTIVVNGCIVKDGNTCSKSVQKVTSVACPIITGVTATLI